MNIQVFLEFTHLHLHLQNPNHPHTHFYTVAKIPGEHKVVSESYVDESHRLYINRHGVRIVFIQTGSISRFVFQFMLVQIFTVRCGHEDDGAETMMVLKR